jgi:hypothetical protein
MSPLLVRKGHMSPLLVRKGHMSPLLVRKGHMSPLLARKGHMWPLLVRKGVIEVAPHFKNVESFKKAHAFFFSLYPNGLHRSFTSNW